MGKAMTVTQPPAQFVIPAQAGIHGLQVSEMCDSAST